ncbi:MAG: tetratricopeptide repeat protein [Akkermansiaceae bacterium]
MAESNTQPSPTTSAAFAEIDLGPSKLDLFLDKHQPKLVIFAILVALGILGYVVKHGLDEAKAEEAGAALAAASNSEEYQEVIAQWPNSNAASTAQILLANSQWPDAKDDSISNLEDFIDSNPAHPAVASAKVSLGLKLINLGKTDEATEILAEVADSDTNTYITSLARVSLGDIAKESGDTEKAKIWYEKAQDNSDIKNDAFASIVETRLLLVNAKPPVKIQPALPEPPAAPQITTGSTSAEDTSPDLPDTIAPQTVTPLVEKPELEEAP